MIRVLLRNAPALLLILSVVMACSPLVGNPAVAPAVPSQPARAVADLAQTVSGIDRIEGWAPDGSVRLYDEATLFELVNGQADAFFAYNFRQVAVQSYENAEGNVLRVEVWELATPEDAYGLFTRNAAGSPPADPVGNHADADPGRRIAFWQDRYFVQVRARQPVTGDELDATSRAMAAVLPAGGERPDVMAALPAADRTDEPAIFFRREISIQDEIWLGGGDLLGLEADGAGALAHHTLEDTPALLLLVRYPSAARAETALANLSGGSISELAAARTSDTTLAALFGPLEPGTAEAWLSGLEFAP